MTSASASHFTAGSGPVSITFSGSFTVAGPGVSGTVDGAVQTRNGAQQLLISGVAEDAAAVLGVLAPAGSRPKLYAYLLRGDDTISGSAQPDLLAGFRGADTLDGGAGIDGAFYTGERAGYHATRTGGAWQVVDHSGLDGVDTLVNVERLSLEDVSVALDLEGNAGTVARILGAVFGRHAVASTELAGLGLRLADTGAAAAATGGVPRLAGQRPVHRGQPGPGRGADRRERGQHRPGGAGADGARVRLHASRRTGRRQRRRLAHR